MIDKDIKKNLKEKIVKNWRTEEFLLFISKWETYFEYLIWNQYCAHFVLKSWSKFNCKNYSFWKILLQLLPIKNFIHYKNLYFFG